MRMVLRCDCGFRAAGELEDHVVAAAREHAREAHGSDVAAEVIIELLRGHRPPADEDGPGDTP